MFKLLSTASVTAGAATIYIRKMNRQKELDYALYNLGHATGKVETLLTLADPSWVYTPDTLATHAIIRYHYMGLSSFRRDRLTHESDLDPNIEPALFEAIEDFAICADTYLSLLPQNSFDRMLLPSYYFDLGTVSALFILQFADMHKCHAKHGGGKILFPFSCNWSDVIDHGRTDQHLQYKIWIPRLNYDIPNDTDTMAQNGLRVLETWAQSPHIFSDDHRAAIQRVMEQ